MSYAVIIGTTSASWNDNNTAPPGTVLFNGELPKNPVWDYSLNNIREMSASELAVLKYVRPFKAGVLKT